MTCVPTKGEVVARVRGSVDAALGLVGDVTVVVATEGAAAVVGGGISVGGGCVIVVVAVVAVVAVVVGVDVVVAARAVGGRGVSFLVGAGTVGVGGLNLMMEKHK